MITTKNIALAGMLAFALLVMGGGQATAAVTCSFTRDLDLGIEGEDVRCLQQYLNSQGFIVASEGVGSVGKETTQFKTLTQKAVIAWQTAHGVTPATGYFGAKSRAKYTELASGTGTPTTPAPTTPTPTTPPPASDSAEIALLKQQIASLTSRLDALERQIEADEDEDEDEEEDEDEDDEESEAEEALEDAEDYFDEVWEEYEKADDAGDNTGDAEDLLEEAEELLEEAEEALDDEDWDEVLDLVEEIEELIEEAEDEL